MIGITFVGAARKIVFIPEFLPYRRIDWTAQRDEKTHSYFCSHGYVCVRVDMRGSGDSEGYYYDEYEKQEQEDCCDVINWISCQDWCTGNVGKLCINIYLCGGVNLFFVREEGG